MRGRNGGEAGKHDEGHQRRKQRQGDGGYPERPREPSRGRRGGSGQQFGGRGLADAGHRLVSSRTETCNSAGDKARLGAPADRWGARSVMLFYNNVAGLRQFQGVKNSPVADRHHSKSPLANGISETDQPLLRKTWISRSRIFLRNVLRLTPSRSAARIWLPRVAASVTESSGCSISRRMRW